MTVLILFASLINFSIGIFSPVHLSHQQIYNPVNIVLLCCRNKLCRAKQKRQTNKMRMREKKSSKTKKTNGKYNTILQRIQYVYTRHSHNGKFALKSIPSRMSLIRKWHYSEFNVASSFLGHISANQSDAARKPQPRLSHLTKQLIIKFLIKIPVDNWNLIRIDFHITLIDEFIANK